MYSLLQCLMKFVFLKEMIVSLRDFPQQYTLFHFKTIALYSATIFSHLLPLFEHFVIIKKTIDNVFVCMSLSMCPHFCENIALVCAKEGI